MRDLDATQDAFVAITIVAWDVADRIVRMGDFCAQQIEFSTEDAPKNGRFLQ